MSLYLRQNNDRLFKDNIYGKDFLSCGQTMSIRHKYKEHNDVNNIKNGLVNNSIVFGMHNLSIDSRTTVDDIPKQAKLIKYGSMVSMMKFLGDTLKYHVEEFANDPNGIYVGTKMYDYFSGLAFSNFMGPKSIIPVGFDSNGDNDSYMTRFHAHAIVPCGLPMLITFTTYNNLCKFTISTDNKYISKPNQFKQCWIDEWNRYASGVDI